MRFHLDCIAYNSDCFHFLIYYFRGMSKPIRAIVSVTNDLYTDQRVHKICTFLTEQGYQVVLVGRKKRSSPQLDPRKYSTKRMRLLFERGPLFYAAYNFRLFLYLLFHRTDVLVSNDLDTLLANYMVTRIKRRVRLVYDSHEYFTEVPELTSRPGVQKFWLRIERRIFPKLTSVYTVNHSIAEIYEKLYGKDVKVVRNISPVWKPQHIKSKKELGIPENKKLIILQGAGINIDRGAEEAVEAMKEIDAVLMIVGDGDIIPALKEKVQKEELNDRVIFYGKKTYQEMMNYTYYADIGLTLDKASNLNYKFSLPNKVFDYMHASAAIIATDIKEVSRIVRKYDLGIILDSFNVSSLSLAINNLLKDEQQLAKYKHNCSVAAEKENWDNELKVLETIYPKIEG